VYLSNFVPTSDEQLQKEVMVAADLINEKNNCTPASSKQE
jgi:hypothetical protein